MSLTLGLKLFWIELLQRLPALLPRLAAAWLLTFLVLLFGFKWVKAHVRPHLMRLDDAVRFWAFGLRYRVRGERDTERHVRTWFFRFWTNFASAPSLTTLSILLPILYFARWGRPVHPLPLHLFFLPGLCFGASMPLSYFTKRIFKRVRPVREHGSFGHRMKDGSFPSGHSLTSLAFWFMQGVAAATYGLSGAVVAGIFAVGLTIVLLTGLSRIYLGVHYPSDILGGYTMGAFWCLVCYFTLLPALIR